MKGVHAGTTDRRRVVWGLPWRGKTSHTHTITHSGSVSEGWVGFMT